MIDLPSSPEKLTIAMSACLRSVIDELQSTGEFHSVYGFGALMPFECISFDPLVFSEVNARKLTDDLRWEAVHHTDEPASESYVLHFAFVHI